MKNEYYKWTWVKSKDEEEYSYLVPIHRGNNVLGAYVNQKLDNPVGVSWDFWSVEEVPEFRDSQFEYSYKKPQKRFNACSKRAYCRSLC